VRFPLYGKARLTLPNRTKFREYFEPSLTKIIQADGVDIGMLKVEERFDCMYLGDIQIRQSYRNKGIALVGLSIVSGLLMFT
jgi:hypothetical protein